MSDTTSLMAVLGPIYLVLGLSILFYAGSWMQLMKEFEKNHYGMLSIGFLDLALGMILIRIYNVWTWDSTLLITLTGWGMFVKGVAYFLAPGAWIKAAMKWHVSLNVLYLHGVIAGAIGIYLSYLAYLV